MVGQNQTFSKIDLRFLLVKITPSRKLGCKYFWNLLIGVFGVSFEMVEKPRRGVELAS